eukprot:1058449-Alexandrium_andersonii.AAC.1
MAKGATCLLVCRVWLATWVLAIYLLNAVRPPASLKLNLGRHRLRCEGTVAPRAPPPFATARA